MENKKRTLEISLEQARKIWNTKSSEHTISESLNAIHGLLLENFTREELEDKKGYTWEESVESCGIVYKTEKQALSALAFAQLSHIVAYANSKSGPPKVDGHGFMVMYCVIAYSDNTLKVEKWMPTYSILPFNTEEDAENSLITNKELWEQFYAGYGL